MRKLCVLVVSLLGVLVVACADGDIGEACEEEGKIDGECVDGAICGKNKNNELVCLKQCLTQADCASNEDCNGVSGTNAKGCRLR